MIVDVLFKIHKTDPTYASRKFEEVTMFRSWDDGDGDGDGDDDDDDVHQIVDASVQTSKKPDTVTVSAVKLDEIVDKCETFTQYVCQRMFSGMAMLSESVKIINEQAITPGGAEYKKARDNFTTLQKLTGDGGVLTIRV